MYHNPRNSKILWASGSFMCFSSAYSCKNARTSDGSISSMGIMRLGDMILVVSTKRRGRSSCSSSTQKEIMQNDCGDRDRDRDNPERPIPIRSTLDMIVFISAPAECGIVHAIILSSAHHAYLKTGANCRRDSLHKIERRISHAGFKAGDRGLGRTRSFCDFRLRYTPLDASIENGMDKRVFWFECVVGFAKFRIFQRFAKHDIKIDIFVAFLAFDEFHMHNIAYMLCALQHLQPLMCERDIMRPQRRALFLNAMYE